MSKQYQKLNPIQHILKRPDMYCGSTKLRVIEDYVAKPADDTYVITKTGVKMSPAILRIFVEPLSNAIDNVERSRKTKTPCTKIKVVIDPKTGKTSVWNNGDVVPIEKNEAENCYNHSLIFGQLLTGSNYDDTEERVLSGRNGLGVKLCNVFSKSFQVKGYDPKNKKSLTQLWKTNMTTTTGPVVKPLKTPGKGYTEVTWTPDFKQFGLKGYTSDIVELYTRYVIDAAMLTGIKIYLNDKLIPVKNIQEYASLYSSSSINEKLILKTDSCNVFLTPSSEFEAISFVNGVFTRLGGQHVDAWSEQIFRPVVDKFNKKSTKSKSPKINISDVKQFFRIFVVSTVVRPEFDGQDKNKLESPDVKAVVKPSQINAIMKWSVISDIEDLIRSKEMVVLKKTERATTKVRIAGYDPANKAGGSQSTKCSLFICEGLSAKTYVVAGIQKGVYGYKGRDWFGVLPVTGKMLNVRNATRTAIAGNKVISNLINAIGLKYDTDYTQECNFRKLNYGRVVVIADADVDGIHIEGLLLNFIHSLFPSLFKRGTSYICSMKTPIARIIHKKATDQLFYDERRFVKYLTEQTTQPNVKYYKGLGTTKPSDVPDTFGLKMIEYKQDDRTSSHMQKAFDKKYAGDRKQWLAEYNPSASSFSLDNTGNTSDMSITHFVNDELIKYSHADCARSIPNGIDGLKESQRKVLFSVMKRSLSYNGKSLKVAQLAGYTAEHSNYHHGEKNLFDTIIGMANEFPGTNNIPLLYRDGMFGTRLEGAHDAADGRYIFTKMEMLTELIFRTEDEPILTQVNDDGDFVQPEFYIPILPMMLINGCIAGIGTGWSSTVPCYNPLTIVEAIKAWLKNKKEPSYPDLKPWYRGFTGGVESCGDGKFATTGIIQKGDKGCHHIVELPVGVWTNKFKDTLDELRLAKKIKNLKNYSTPDKVHFVFNDDKGFNASTDSLKMVSFVNTNNLVMFDRDCKLKKYESVEDVITNFCIVRYEYYGKRKQHQLGILNRNLGRLKNKERFVTEVIQKKIPLMTYTQSQLVSTLKKRRYQTENNSYDYLLNIPVSGFTTDRLAKLTSEIKTLLGTKAALEKTTASKMWLSELERFVTEYKKWDDTN